MLGKARFLVGVLLVLYPAICFGQFIIPDRGPMVSVTGTGVVFADPDMAKVLLGVYVLDPDLTKAKASSDTTVKRLLQLADSLKITGTDIASASINIEPRYSETEDHGFLGYEVSRSVDITLRSLALLDRLIDQAIQAGANRQFSVELKSSRERELRQEALALAIENAKEQAAKLAAGFGATLGPVRSIDTEPRYRSSSAASLAMDTYGSGTFRPSALRFESQLAVSFVLQ